MENVNGSYYIPNISVKKPTKEIVKDKHSEIREMPKPTAKASAQNVAAYYQNINVSPVEKSIDKEIQKAATLPNGGSVFRNELDGGKAVVKNAEKDGLYEVSLIRDGVSTPEEVFILTEEEFFMNPDLCSGFVVPKDDGTYDVTSLDPDNKESFGTNNMNKTELIKFMDGKYFN